MHYIANIYLIQIEIIYILLEKVKQKNVVNNILMTLAGWEHIKNISKCVLERERTLDIIILENNQVLSDFYISY